MRLSFRHKRMTSVDVQVRHIENSNTSTYGFFRYHANDKKLEEMDTTSGEYKSVE